MASSSSNLRCQLEALLFIAARPLSVKKLAELTEADRDMVFEALQELVQYYATEHRGMILIHEGQDYQMTTHPDVASLVQRFLKDETTGELTRPQLEAVTIIAYRGPISKSELEQIRGVNCSLILRNLLIRGLIQEEEKTEEQFQTRYTVTMDFLRFLGVGRREDLPDFSRLHADTTLEHFLNEGQTSDAIVSGGEKKELT